MGRKGKEPAGLRRWRLARKARKTRSRPTKTKSYRKVKGYMAKRKRGRKGRKGSKAVPLAVVLPVLGVGIAAWKDSGGALSGAGSVQNRFIKTTTGYDMAAKTFNVDNAKGYWMGQVAGIIVHKVAAKTINRHIKKLTMGYLVL